MQDFGVQDFGVQDFGVQGFGLQRLVAQRCGVRLSRRPSQLRLAAVEQRAKLETGPAWNPGDGCGNSRHEFGFSGWVPSEKVGPLWAGLFSSTSQAPIQLSIERVTRAMDGAVGRQARLVLLGQFILIMFAGRATRRAEANQQNRDCHEQTQQKDKLQKINNLHFDPLNR